MASDLQALAVAQHNARLRWLSEAESPAWDRSWDQAWWDRALDRTEPTDLAGSMGSSAHLGMTRNDVEHNGNP